MAARRTQTDEVGRLATLTPVLALVWPEHDDRPARLRTAVDVARADPPTVAAADLASFVLGLDGSAVAWTHGHGRTLRWVGTAQRSG